MADNKEALTASRPARTLPSGWTEHLAPSGHTYYYNVHTKQSTYHFPGPISSASSAKYSSQPLDVLPQPPKPNLRLSDPRVANAFMSIHAANNVQKRVLPHHDKARQTGGGDWKRRRMPIDRPVSKSAIPGHDPWILVYTKYGRRFAYHPVKNTSYWRIPEKLKPAILELDKDQIRQKTQNSGAAAATRDGQRGPDGGGAVESVGTTENNSDRIVSSMSPTMRPIDGSYNGSEFEEVEGSDDTGDEEGSGPSSSKKPRTNEMSEHGPLEFGEDDIAFQLLADAEGPEAGVGDAGADMLEEEATELFKALLEDCNANPFSSWEKLVEDGDILLDPRYTALSTTKMRKAVWEEWSRAKIKETKEKRNSEQKKDPLSSYLSLLEEKATFKLYWPEFKRKYRKEAAMKDPSLPEKDKEKLYRDYVNCLKLPQSTQKANLVKLLESLPPGLFTGSKTASDLPRQLTTDIRYVALNRSVRKSLIEAYLHTV